MGFTNNTKHENYSNYQSRKNMNKVKKTKKRLSNFGTLFFGVMSFLLSCSKNNDTGGPNKREVKYEVTGSYSGQILFAYTDASGGNTSTIIIGLPWTKEITYSNSLGGFGYGGNTNLPNFGLAGQTVTVKVYSGGTIVQTKVATANARGLIDIPSSAYVFP